MKELNLEPILATESHLEKAECDLSLWEMEMLRLEKGIARSSPEVMEKRCRDLSKISMILKFAVRSGGMTSKTIRERLEERQDHPEVTAVLKSQLKRSQDADRRAIRLKRRIRDLEMLLLGAIRDMESETDDSRIIRLVGDEEGRMSVQQIYDQVEKDHQVVADALAAWKLMHSETPVLSIRRSSTRDDVDKALRRLERTGHAARVGIQFGSSRWQVYVNPYGHRIRA